MYPRDFMAGSDEIIFAGSYKGFTADVRFDLSGVNESEVAAVLGSLSDKSEPFAYSLSGIDLNMIEKYAKPSGTGLKAVIDFLKSHSQSEIKSSLEKAIAVKELMPAAESCFMNFLLKSAKVSFRLGDSVAVPVTKPTKETNENQIAFVGSFKGWVAIKKLTIQKVEDWEVAAIISGINHTIVNKAFDFSGTEKNDALVNKITAGKRKSYSALVESLELLLPELKGNKLSDAYLICKVFETLGFKPYASPEMLTKAHPS